MFCACVDGCIVCYHLSIGVLYVMLVLLLFGWFGCLFSVSVFTYLSRLLACLFASLFLWLLACSFVCWPASSPNRSTLCVCMLIVCWSACFLCVRVSLFGCARVCVLLCVGCLYVFLARKERASAPPVLVSGAFVCMCMIVCLFVCPSCLTVCLSVCVFVRLCVWVLVFACVFVCVFFCLCVALFVCFCIQLFVCLIV